MKLTALRDSLHLVHAALADLLDELEETGESDGTHAAARAALADIEARHPWLAQSQQPNQIDEPTLALRAALLRLLSELTDNNPAELANYPNTCAALEAFDTAHPQYMTRAQIEECPTPDQETSPED